jgi:hypothetical protein
MLHIPTLAPVLQATSSSFHQTMKMVTAMYTKMLEHLLIYMAKSNPKNQSFSLDGGHKITTNEVQEGS